MADIIPCGALNKIIIIPDNRLIIKGAKNCDLSSPVAEQLPKGRLDKEKQFFAKIKKIILSGIESFVIFCFMIIKYFKDYSQMIEFCKEVLKEAGYTIIRKKEYEKRTQIARYARTQRVKKKIKKAVEYIMKNEPNEEITAYKVSKIAGCSYISAKKYLNEILSELM